MSAKNINRQRLLSYIFLVIFLVTLGNYIILYGYSAYLFPLPVATILLALLFSNRELIIVTALILSLSAGFIAGGDLQFSFILLIGGLVAAYFSWQARRRSQIIRAGFLAGLIQSLLILLFNWRTLPWLFDLNGLNLVKLSVSPFQDSGWAWANGMLSAFLAAGSLPIFEYLFKVATNINLLELCDTEHPLLKKLNLSAPGTFQHSLIVSNLAEQAAREIGANSLLARVGGYYHDIGKVNKPEYFVENLRLKEDSRHEDLAPSMSRLVIINHVKVGVELARRYRLNPAIIDFINQHHGTSLVYYFYRRALEKASDKISEEGFRYPGPKPQTKETAIVLLADSTEAASRVLDEPTPNRIGEAVHKIINNKFIDGQLDECELTLRDLHKIANTFTHILSGIYHSRVKYPDENRHSKSQAGQTNRLPEKDKDARPKDTG